MTRKQILTADAMTLTVEAHRILGRTIERRGEVGMRTTWCLVENGKTVDAAGLNERELSPRVLECLSLALYAYSWADAQELWEHPKFPSPRAFLVIEPGIYLAAGTLIDELYPDVEDARHKEPTLPLLITRVFVLANGGTEVADGEKKNL